MARRFVTLLVGMALVVGACGGVGLSAEEQEMIDEIVAAVSSDPEEGRVVSSSLLGLGASEALCFADGIVEIVGMDRLRDAGLGDGSLSVREALVTVDWIIRVDREADWDLSQQWIDMLFRCLDMEQRFTEFMMYSGVSSGGAECMARRMVDEDVLRCDFGSSVLGFRPGLRDAPLPGYFDAMSDAAAPTWPGSPAWRAGKGSGCRRFPLIYARWNRSRFHLDRPPRLHRPPRNGSRRRGGCAGRCGPF